MATTMTVQCAATVFQVKEIAASLRFYRDVLGFELDFEFGNYAGISKGEALLHLCAHDTWQRPCGGGAVMIFCDEIDRFHDEVKGRGATIRLAPTDEPYGMRDFAVSDPDGNMLTFGCSLEPR
jgi:catechol 2,3-dioxygenase-like lactoylglutathione lyase family enzyme